MSFYTIAAYLILALYISVSSETMYSGQNTALGNAGKNIKPMLSTIKEFSKELENIKQDTGALDDAKVSNEIEKYANKHIEMLKYDYSLDIDYSLCNKGILKDCIDYKKHEGVYHTISDEEIKYYRNAIDKYKLKSINNIEIVKALINAINNNPNYEANVKTHFTKYAKEYLTEHNIYHFSQIIEQPKTAIAKTESKLNAIVKYGKPMAVSATEQPEIAIAKTESKLNAIVKYGKPMAVLAGIAGLVGIGSTAYAVGRANAMQNITRDIKDHTNTHVSIWHNSDSIQHSNNTCTMCNSCILHYKETAAA